MVNGRTMFRSLMAMLVVAVGVLASSDALARASVTGMRLGTHPDNVTRVVMDLSESVDFSVTTQAGPDRIVISAPDLAWATSDRVARPFGAVRALDAEPGRVSLALKAPAVVKSSFLIPPRDGQGWRLVVDVQETTRAAFLAASGKAPAVSAAPAPAPAPAPVVEAAPPAEPKRIVLYSPEVPAPKPEPARPAPAKVEPVKAEPLRAEPKPEPAKPEPVKAEPAKPEPIKAEPVRLASARPGAAPIMSAPVPPPLARPAAEPDPAVAAAPAPVPLPDPARAATKASVRMPVGEPEPKGLPADGRPVIVIDPGHGGVDPGAIGVSGIYEKHITLAVARDLKQQLEQGGRYKVHLTRDRDIFIRLRERVAIGRQHGADLFISLHADSVGNPQLKGLSVYTLSQNASDSEAQALADKENKADLIAGIDLSHESADVANILIDLAQRETMNRSAVFAGGLVGEMSRETTLLANSHRFAGFAVLKAPDVPSVLVELGYLSNEVEERNLRKPEYRAKLAKAIARSVDQFFLQGQKAARRP